MAPLERAIAVALSAHAGQIGHDGGPYILHPIRVMLLLDAPEQQIVGVLHDVLEKSLEWDEVRLRGMGFSDRIVDTVVALTRQPGEDKFAVAGRARDSQLGRLVKYADLMDNISMTTDAARLAEYRKELDILDFVPPPEFTVAQK